MIGRKSSTLEVHSFWDKIQILEVPLLWDGESTLIFFSHYLAKYVTMLLAVPAKSICLSQFKIWHQYKQKD